jgi:hypothetical protein
VRALADHAVARLQFYRDTGTLIVTDRSMQMPDLKDQELCEQVGSL